MGFPLMTNKLQLLLLTASMSILYHPPVFAETVVSVTGPIPNDPLSLGSVTQVLAVHWSETTSFSDVSIAAEVACFSICDSSSRVDAWLMSQIGPGTTVS